MNKINNERNLTMLMDFYELTMANGYFNGKHEGKRVVFDMFYRSIPDKGGFVIAAGLEQFVEYIQDMHFREEDIDYLKNKKLFSEDFLEFLKTFKFTGNIFAVPEGTIVYPNTPIVTIEAPLVEAQLIETMLLLTINHQSLIATKANRIVKAAKGKPVMDFGARRAHGYDAAVYGSRAAYIGGVAATATTLSDELFGIPSVGTMAHSWVQYFGSDYEAFKAYATAYPSSCTLLVDTFNVLESGIPNAIRVAKEILEPQGERLKGIRLDSGDLAYLSKETRKMLDESGMSDCKIIASNSLDEYLIQDLFLQGAMIDTFGVGENLITSKSNPVFGGVYKLVAVKEKETYSPRIKVSENIEKIINPCFKRLYRVYDEHNIGIFDFIAKYDETIDIKSLKLVDQKKPWKQIEVKDTWTIKEMHQQIFKDGHLVYDLPSLDEIRKYTENELTKVWDEEKRFQNPHLHYVDLTEELYKIKQDLLNKS